MEDEYDVDVEYADGPSKLLRITSLDYAIGSTI